MQVSNVKEYPVIWLQAAGCTGCSVSLLNVVNPSIKNVLIDEVLPGSHINLRFHATVMAGSGRAVIKVLEDTSKQKKGGYILMVEGAIPTAKNGIHGVVGERNEKPATMLSRVEELARDALAVIAVGTCAAFGGIPAGYPNPTQCRSVGEVLDTLGIGTPLVNIPGCPPHPDWLVGTVASVLLAGLPKPEGLDEYKRPKAFYGQTIHENCPRRAYYDENKFAKKFGEPGCNYELGCRGPVTHADCPLRLWNDKVSWCVGCGGTCIGCTEPSFPDMLSPLYEKLSTDVIPEIEVTPMSLAK
jgi:hydrogenase small subunit